MRRRNAPEDAGKRPPEALRRFRTADWLRMGDAMRDEEWSAVGARSWVRYRAARRAWAAERGLSAREMDELCRERDAAQG
jgi:hypothetical protein